MMTLAQAFRHLLIQSYLFLSLFSLLESRARTKSRKMGIKNLMKLINEEAPSAVKELNDMKELNGLKVAIDASMALYQFLVAVRTGPGNAGGNTQLTNDAGEVTSHVQGMFNRTIKMMQAGLRVIYVFDGKPPSMKGDELKKRSEARAKAEKGLEEAKSEGNTEEMEKFNRRLVKVTPQHNEDCKELLTLMGIPYVNAPCEAEAQCAELAKGDEVYATATEDMDALTFRTPKLLRRMTGSQSSKNKQPILEIDVARVLELFKLDYEQFVDMCILCGCDYCSTITGIGPKTALTMIQEHKSIEKILQVLESKGKKKDIPAEWYERKVPKGDLVKATASETEKAERGPETEAEAEVKDASAEKENQGEEIQDGENTKEAEINVDDLKEGEYDVVPPCYVEARRLFVQAEVTPRAEVKLQWKQPQEEALKKFLCDRMGFGDDRVGSAIQRLKDATAKKPQMRLTSFFKPSASSEDSKRKLQVENDKIKKRKKLEAAAKKGKGKLSGAPRR